MSPTESGPSYRVRTDPQAADPMLRGRTYAVPFDRIWKAASRLVSGDLRGWSLTWADDREGVLEARVAKRLLRPAGMVRVRISLDSDAQTRVDMAAGPSDGGADLGVSRRRIQHFFSELDRAVAPTLARIRATRGLLVVFCLAGVPLACAPDTEPPGTPPPATATPSQPTPADSGRIYERSIVFLSTQSDSVFVVPWFFTVRTGAGVVRRHGRGWLLRGAVWDPFFDEAWETPLVRAPWRPMPHGALRLQVGEGDALEQVSFVSAGRRLDLMLESSLAEWTGRRGETFRFLAGGLVLAERRVSGLVLDLNRARGVGEGASGDWMVLTSGDSLHLVLHAPLQAQNREPGGWRGWAHLDFRDLPFANMTVDWATTRAFDRARRDVPVGWTIRSGSGNVQGSLNARSSQLLAGEGEGPLLPVDGLFEVSGTITIQGAEYPVHGLLRHAQGS